MQPGEMDALLQQAIRAIVESFEAVTSPDTFDILCSFLKCVDAVPGILMNKSLDVIMSGFATEVDAAAQTSITKTSRRARHIKYRWRFTENEQYMKSQPIKLRVYKVICLAVKHHGHGPAAQTSIMQSLQYYEHLSEPMAGCLNVLLKEFDHAQLGEEILRRSLRRASMRKIPMAQGTFLVLSHRLSHRELACSEDLTSDAHQTLNGLYDLLLERTLDLSSYVRSKVLTVLSRLCDLPASKQRYEDATDVDEEDGDKGGDSDEVDSIMDKDELESFRAVEGSESASRWTVPSSANFKKLSSTCVAHTSGLRSPNKPSTPSTRSETSRTRPVPSAAEEQVSSALPDADAMDEDLPLSAQALISTWVTSRVKYIVYLELVEREWKRQKQEISEKIARDTGNDAATAVRETELVYGPDSRLALNGPLLVRICGRPDYSRTRRCGRWRREPSFALPHPGDVEGFEHRNSIAITLGDVAVTFSTIVDENSDELYPGSKANWAMSRTHIAERVHFLLDFREFF
ncbi:hypothetical protein BGW80DRAFT_1468845 [Lactifluus volemus]|nr:hypothetical protein BGW80DRAFT_1468845 [Lactifluus volemus]